MNNNSLLNVNARLAEEVLIGGREEEFRVLLALKRVAGGNGAYFWPTTELKKKLCGICGWRSVRTATRKIKRLRQIGWVGTDDKGRHYVRSFSCLLNEYDVKSDSVHQLSVEFCVKSKQRMKATLFSVALGKIIANRHFALVRQNATHVSTGRGSYSYKPGQGERHSPSDISVSFLANRFGKAKATIHRWKHLAMKLGMIERSKRHFTFPGTTDVKAIRSAFPEDAHRTYLSSDKGCVAIQLTDELGVELKYKSRQQ